MSDEYVERIEQFLVKHEINDYRFEQRSKHRVVVIEHGGKAHQVFFPSTGSDRRGPLKAVSTVRHVLGLMTGKVAEAPNACKNRRYKRRKALNSGIRLTRNSAAEVAATPDKFYGPLREIKARLTAPTNPEQLGLDSSILVSDRNHSSDAKTVRLRTPWLGERPRYVVI